MEAGGQGADLEAESVDVPKASDLRFMGLLRVVTTCFGVVSSYIRRKIVGGPSYQDPAFSGC